MTRPHVLSRIGQMTFLGVFLVFASEPSRSLDILLTNDDGIEAQGISILRQALLAKGHEVLVVAPDSNRSGSGLSLTVGPVSVEQRSIGFAVSSTPATAVLLSRNIKPDKKFDILISGINHGANVGYVTPVSGTVGAALMGASPMGLKLPSIAISTDLPDRDAGSEAGRAQLRKAAEFLIQIISTLQKATPEDGSLLPSGLALNANYPLEEEVAGIRFCRQGSTGTILITYEKGGDGVFFPKISSVSKDQKDPAGTDTKAYRAGFATIVPVWPYLSASGSTFQRVEEKLGQLLIVSD